MTRITRIPHFVAFFVGLAAIGWVGFGQLGSSPLALTITALIAAFYLIGASELWRFTQATAQLAHAVDTLREAPPRLADWVDALPAGLRNAVRLRIEGERVGLPGPALAPYLAGLLVLLGMLGTFLGMVVTLNGTGAALDGAADVQAIRASLAAPVKGLGLAFGTSVAGVAASAMLGLVSALCRRDRLRVAQALDTRISTLLRGFSRTHQREAGTQALQQQAAALPLLVDRLQAMLGAIERQGQSTHEALLASQERFQGRAEVAYASLAASVGRALTESLAEGARIAGATIEPVVTRTMTGIARESAALHAGIERSVQQQLDGLSNHVEAGSARVAADWQAALATQQRGQDALTTGLHATLERFAETFEQRADALLSGVDQRAEAQRRDLALTHAAHAAEAGAQDRQRLLAWTDALGATALALQREWQQAGALGARQQQAICDTLAETARELAAQSAAHARSTIAEIGQLAQAAAEAPRAAAELVFELREKLADSLARDNATLAERSRLLATLDTLLGSVTRASTEQRAAVDALVETSASLLERAAARFAERAEAESGRMAAAGAQVNSSAIEVASLGEAFGFAVQQFSMSNDKLGAQLARIEAALAKAGARSDEQLGYYVAQAREVMELSMLSQRQIVEDLQRFGEPRALAGHAA